MLRWAPVAKKHNNDIFTLNTALYCQVIIMCQINQCFQHIISIQIHSEV